ncbi:MAG TPA: hypothetical protein VG936_11450 [Lacunisphaera sp.]|nr:hypothetical protein [Lacunisphaera sp.]
MRTRPRIFLLLALGVATASASTDRIITAVFSRTSEGYHRMREADGSFKREYYALMPGHYYPGIGKDASIDPVKFPQVAGLAAQLLGMKNYWFAKDAGQATLLLEISWGKTIPSSNDVASANMAVTSSAFNHFNDTMKSLKALEEAEAQGGQALTRGPDGAASKERILAQDAENDLQNSLYEMKMFQDMRRNADEHNAKLLGYVEEINHGDTPARFAGLGTNYDDLISDLENERYYIIIAAYDFAAAKKGEMKQQWITRVSVQAQGNRFNEAAAYMLAKASRYFGQDSGRLIREFDRQGKVTLGELQVVGVVPQSQVQEPPAEKK